MMHRETHTGGHKGIGLNGMIFLSLLAHLLALSLLFFSRSLPVPKWTFGPVYSVQLVNLPADLPEKKEVGLLDRGMRNETAGQTILKKESIDALPSVPIYDAKRNSKPITGMDIVPEATRKNIQAKALSPVLGSVAKERERILSHAKPSGEELNAKMRNYYGLIWSRIKSLWTLPQGISPEKNVEVVIHAQILRDGTVINVGFEKRSGNRYFDESALRAVKKVASFPPLPEEVKDDSIEVGIRFHPSELR